jgi:hypothetical protein
LAVVAFGSGPPCAAEAERVDAAGSATSTAESIRTGLANNTRPTDDASEADPLSAESYYDQFDSAWDQAVLPPVNWAVLLQVALYSGAHVEVSSALLFSRRQPEVPHVNSNSHSHTAPASTVVAARLELHGMAAGRAGNRRGDALRRDRTGGAIRN